MADSIEIYGNFDGGNPQDPNAIIQTGPNAFTIIPFSEDNDPNYKFRLDLKIFNNSSDTIILDLTIDWQEPRFNHLRNYIYLKHSDDADWFYHPMQVNRTQAMGTIEFQEGETYVCLHPKYNYLDYLHFVAGIPENDIIKKEKIGLSPEGRELWLIRIGAETERTRKRIMLVSRIHPYETSGSYCIEGIVNHFIENLSHFSNPPAPSSNLPFPFNASPFTVFLIPMANPDGVYNGLCKKTALHGIDLSKEKDGRNGVWRIIAELVDSIRPAVYCEIHNWMYPDLDGLFFLNRYEAWRFTRNFPSQASFKKRWKVFLKKGFLRQHPGGFKKYCRDNYNAVTMAVEYPWFLRTTDNMKNLGVMTLKGLINL